MLIEKKDEAKESSSVQQNPATEKKPKEVKENVDDVFKNASNKEWEFSIKSVI